MRTTLFATAFLATTVLGRCVDTALGSVIAGWNFNGLEAGASSLPADLGSGTLDTSKTSLLRV